MRRQQHLIFAGAGVIIFAVGKAPYRQARVDHRFIEPIRQGDQSVVRHAEAPGLVIGGLAIGNPIGLIGQGEDVLPQLGERQDRPDRRAVVQHMQVAVPKIDHALTGLVPDIGIADHPLGRDGPVEHLCSAWHFMNCQADFALQPPECFAHAFAGDGTADRENFGQKAIDRLADAGRFPVRS